MGKDFYKSWLKSLLRLGIDAHYFVPFYLNQDEYNEVVEEIKKENEEEQRRIQAEIEFMKTLLPSPETAVGYVSGNE